VKIPLSDQGETFDVGVYRFPSVIVIQYPGGQTNVREDRAFHLFEQWIHSQAKFTYAWLPETVTYDDVNKVLFWEQLKKLDIVWEKKEK